LYFCFCFWWGIVVTIINERIEVIDAEESERPDFNDMINRVWEIKQQHKINDNNLTIYVDAANPEIWSSLKRMLKEPRREQRQKKRRNNVWLSTQESATFRIRYHQMKFVEMEKTMILTEK
jgi:hypothetical protein